MNRAKQIQLIQVAKNKLCLDEVVYRSILMKLTQKNSLREMSMKQLFTVFEHLKSLGFKVKSKKEEVSPSLRPQLALIRSLWVSLHEKGIVRDDSEHALNRFVKKMVGIEALQWLDVYKASKVIEHLKQWLARAGNV